MMNNTDFFRNILMAQLNEILSIMSQNDYFKKFDDNKFRERYAEIVFLYTNEFKNLLKATYSDMIQLLACELKNQLGKE